MRMLLPSYLQEGRILDGSVIGLLEPAGNIYIYINQKQKRTNDFKLYSVAVQIFFPLAVSHLQTYLATSVFLPAGNRSGYKNCTHP